MIFHECKQKELESISAYLSAPISRTIVCLIRYHDEIIEFRERTWDYYLSQKKVTFRVYATHASSTESKYNFRKIKRIVLTDRVLRENTFSNMACVLVGYWKYVEQYQAGIWFKKTYRTKPGHLWRWNVFMKILINHCF